MLRVFHRVTALGGIPALCFLTCILWLHALSLQGTARPSLLLWGVLTHVWQRALLFLTLVSEREASLCFDPSFQYMLCLSLYISLSSLCTPSSHASLGLGLRWQSLTLLKPDRRRFSLPPNSISFYGGLRWGCISLFRVPTLWAFSCFQ